MINKKSINKVILVGHVGNDPDVRFTQNGRLVASFSLATHEIKKEASEHTEWHNIVAWAKTGEFVEQYIKKGQLVCVEGAIRTRKWTDKANVVHSITEIFANNVIPLEWKE
tara:strand:- start:121 stop:453 length:333 start_codon:yes stop_codon:yes gene_type:complete